MFNKLKEKLSGFKESITNRILEKAAGSIPVIGNRSEPAAAQQEIKSAPEIPVKTPSENRSDAVQASQAGTVRETVRPSRISLVDKAKSLILEREVILDEKDLEEPLWGLEMALLESDVALPVAEEIVSSVKSSLVGSRKKIGSDTGDLVESALRAALLKVLSKNVFDFDEFIKNAPKPVKILFVGVNGTGKTTSIAKVARYLRDRGYSVVLAAGDTFRAGAIEQLETHGQRLDLKVIKHKTGGDPAAVIFDAIEYAKAHKKDVVLADTAGRLHTNINLMDQMKKIVRVTKPDMLIFVDEAIAGNDAVERARLFNESVPITGTILTKTDADAKGGSAISIAYVTGKPILFLGVGQDYPDLVKFDPEWLVERLLGD
ncbi:signal recognition particle-docking protein FtsY [Methanothrix sp.]|uniref:signal recognition particle-docking protein FtsY n=1 Tax=Methanothrix sp. TaxID=90426 RepID=UPI002B785B95|nr:signal recognition particle-docking protein FtsY [Methanothrix sp.]HOK58994.1 signal recognition particle-docking protein FtsY [Methanothrix sp.]HOL44277.1 signal recognition particle-docking protein FtsY [Methanothrix sp.]HPO89255.1 signal recognition particle-docking protein FtsY [Methanothrix sp.]